MTNAMVERRALTTLRNSLGPFYLAFLSLLPGFTVAEEPSPKPDQSVERPQISSFVHLPFPVKVPQRILDIANKGEPIPYDRQLPIFGRELAERGYVFPKPFGGTVFSVYNEQVNIITDISVALGIGGGHPRRTSHWLICLLSQSAKPSATPPTHSSNWMPGYCLS